MSKLSSYLGLQNSFWNDGFKNVSLIIIVGASWGMRVGNQSALASISASSTELKRIETQHCF